MAVFVDKPGGGQVKVAFGIKGSINEHLATAWLMKSGYEVFRNVAPVGRADLVAKNWSTGELIWVDVKSESYDPSGCNGVTDASEKQREQAAKYAGSDIKYLIVEDDGHCRWHGDDKSDPIPKNDKFWLDPKSGQRFLHPRNALDQRQWSIFAHYMLKYYRDDMNQDQIDLLYNVNRSTTGRGRHLSRLELEMLPGVRLFLYRKITGEDRPTQPASNDNDGAISAAA